MFENIWMLEKIHKESEKKLEKLIRMEIFLSNTFDEKELNSMCLGRNLAHIVIHRLLFRTGAQS